MKLTDLRESVPAMDYSFDEASMEIDPKHRPFIEMGHKIRAALEPSSGVKWEDEEFNKAAGLTTHLINLGANFGPKSPAEALKKADVDVEEFKAIITKASQVKAAPKADDDVDDNDEDEFAAPDDDAIARQADRRARGK